MEEKERPTLHLGKAGMSPEFVGEVKRNLKQHKTVKIKMLKSARTGQDRRALATELAAACKARLVRVVGFTCVLSREKM